MSIREITGLMKVDRIKSIFQIFVIWQIALCFVIGAVISITPVFLPEYDELVVQKSLFRDSGMIGPIDHGSAVRSESFALDKGNYTLNVNYSCTSENNYISVVSDTLDNEGYLNERWQNTVVSDHSITIGFTLDSYVDDLSVAVINNDDYEFFITDINIMSNTEVSSAPSTILARFLSTLLLTGVFFGLFDLLIYKCINDRKVLKIYGLLFVISLVLILPLLRPGLYNGNDLAFHVMRIYGIRDGILNGHFPVKLQSQWYGGYGYPVGAFYGDFLLYIPALMSIIGIPVTFAYKFTLFFVQLLTVFTSHDCFKGIIYFISSGNKIKESSYRLECFSICGAAAYAGMFFRCITLYEATIGELFAAAFLPFIAFAFVLLIKGRRIQSIMMFVIGFTGLINTHILTTAMVVVFLVIFSLVFFKYIFNKYNFCTLLIAALAVIVTNLHFIVPFVDMSMDDIDIMSSGHSAELIQDKGADTIGFFTDDIYNVTIRVILLLVSVFVVAQIVRLLKHDRTVSLNKFYPLISLMMITLLSLIMCTYSFPWDLLAQIPVAGKYVGVLQFPMRFLQIADLLSVLMMIEYFRVRDEGIVIKKLSTRNLVIGLLLFFVIGGTVFSFRQYRPVDRVSYDAEVNIHSDWISGDEYLLTGTNPHDLPSLEACLARAPEVVVSDVNRTGDSIFVYYSSNENCEVEFPLFNYRHYRAYLMTYDGKTSLDILNGNNNRISLILPPTDDGAVNVRFVTPWYWHCSYIVSLAGTVLIIYKYIKNKARS